MARKQISVLTIGLLITTFGFLVIGVGAFTSASGICPINTATLQINSLTASPNPVGIGQAFTVSGSIFAGTGCPSSDAGTNYGTYNVYWWIDGLAGYSGQFVVNQGGGFTITNIPTISTSGTYTITVSPYAQSSNQNSGDVCTPTSSYLTCTNAQTTIKVQSTQAQTYSITFNVSPIDPGGIAMFKNSATGATQYDTLTSNSAQFTVPAGSYYFSFAPNNDPSVVGTQCLNPIENAGPYNFPGTTLSTISAPTTTYNCGTQSSSVTFNVEPTVSGTITFNGQTQNIASNGIETFTNVPAGTYTALITPSSNYPNCLYNPASVQLSVPYSGTLPVSLTASNSQSCVAPTTQTTTATTHSTAQSSSSSTATSGCELLGTCPPPKTTISGLEIIGALISVFGIFTTFAGAVRGRR